MKDSLLPSFLKQFKYYKLLGTRTFEQLSDEQLFFKPNSGANSIAMIVKHMTGNMRSRFTDFLTSDGEKPWRNRETEFDDSLTTRMEVIDHWNTGWALVLDTVSSLDDAQMEDIVYIRNKGHTVGEALLRQLAHHAYHTGQIVHLGVMQKGEDWQSLSIPKGESDSYNQAAFAKTPHRGHFTDDIISAGPERTQ